MDASPLTSYFAPFQYYQLLLSRNIKYIRALCEAKEAF